MIAKNLYVVSYYNQTAAPAAAVKMVVAVKMECHDSSFVGPLTFEENGRTDLVGVVSFGIGCARSTHYGVYARITSVLPWIYEHGIRENANKCKK